MLDIALVPATPPKKAGPLRLLAAALAALSPRMWCSLCHSPMPELREVGHEWRGSNGA